MTTALNIAKGIILLNSYCTDDKCHVHAEHDIIYAGPLFSDVIWNSEDVSILEEMGWFVTEDDSWAIHT